MNDPGLAAIELRRCVEELKFPGVQIGSHIQDWNMDAPELDPFWAEAELVSHRGKRAKGGRGATKRSRRRRERASGGGVLAKMRARAT